MDEEMVRYKELLSIAMKSHGWQPSRYRTDGWTKSYETAVGLKTAFAYGCFVSDTDGSDPRIWLCADYQSEGRNVLESCSNYVRPATPTERIPEVVASFLERVEKKIAESYAVRLFALGVRPRPMSAIG